MTGFDRLSLSEIDALCRKAARGSGCPWGMAEEAGKVARWLASHGLPGPQGLAALLGAARNCSCCGSSDAPRCSLAVGAELSDWSATIVRQGCAEFGAVAQPLLVLAQAGRSAAALGVALTLQWTGFRASCAPDGMVLERAETLGAAVATDVACSVGRAVGSSRPPEPWSRPVDSATVVTLEALAARTYAPATEASRLTGAGAPNLDKD